MKQISHAAIVSLFLLLIILFSATSAVPAQQDETTLQEDDFSRLMGLEKCGDKDEDCEKRRMITEAHLDYIYTQHHHHP
ncbi:hypothetical protein CDL12_17153 [Handroanthus impetiginosus]|uniref:Phytosulfokine n=1 Tax=Handroanthus impetiginosus TaxID=429701 RepID=A0A2G9GYC2_9LAMI|nr:hypothetical protein CDL12_17153 [Handroanthus impetiginosus]